jgi:hypothetical protein
VSAVWQVTTLPCILHVQLIALRYRTYFQTRNRNSAWWNGINRPRTRSLFKSRIVRNIFPISKEGGGHGCTKEERAKSGLEHLPSSGQGDADEIHTPVAWKHATLRPYAGTMAWLSPESVKASQLPEIDALLLTRVAGCLRDADGFSVNLTTVH